MMAKKRRRIKGMKIGQVIKRYRKVRGKRREVFVKRVARKKYKIRLVRPKTKKRILLDMLILLQLSNKSIF